MNIDDIEQDGALCDWYYIVLGIWIGAMIEQNLYHIEIASGSCI